MQLADLQLPRGHVLLVLGLLGSPFWAHSPALSPSPFVIVVLVWPIF